MGLMDRLRNSTKIIFWVLIIAFGLLWGLADTGAIDAVMSGPRSLGEVNGQAISGEEYNARVNAYAQRYQDQTGSAPNMEMRAYYEELAWDELVLERIINSEMIRLGIQVTDDEIVQMITGPVPHPMVAQYFTREDGTVDRLAMQAAIQAPENTPIWINIEAQLREQRGREKLNAYIETSLRVTENEIRQEYVRENSIASFQFVRFPFSAVDEADINVSDSDIRSYYRSNSDKFKQEHGWRFKFVEFSKAATAEDTLRAVSEMVELRSEFARATNDSVFVRQNFSDAPYFGGWLNPSEVNWYLADAVALADGEVTEVVVHDAFATIAKKVESRRGTTTYARARVIRLNFNDANKNDVLGVARELIVRANSGESFGELARAFSNDATAARGGEMGYVNRTDFSTAIGNALFNGSVGSVTAPLEDGNSYVIFQIVDRSNMEVRIAQLSRQIDTTGGDTIRRQLERADDFREFADISGFDQEVTRNNYMVREGFATRGTPFVSGVGQSRVLLRELEKITANNTISDIIELDDRILVVQVTEVVKEGTRPLDEVRAQIENTLRTERRKEITASRVRALLASNSSMEALAAADGKEVLSASNVRMSANTIPGAGREPGVVGAAFGVALNTVSPVINGENAAFVLFVTDRIEADGTNVPAGFREQTRQRLSQTRIQSFQEVWIDRLKESADIKDFRRFYNL
jgi:peptidyl-prolyl cis-trans isomerase D